MKTIKVKDYLEIPTNFTGIVEFSNGSKRWYKEGKRHRLDGPAWEFPNGSKYWYKEDKLHRLDGPAWEFPKGDKRWYKEGELHRLDGPAWEWANGDKEWYIDGERVTKKEFPKAVLLYKCSLVLAS